MTAVDDLRTAARLLRKKQQVRKANWLTRIANTWTTVPDPKDGQEREDALILARKVLAAVVLPDHVAVMVRSGHAFEADSPVHTSTHRWTCLVCGDAVLDSGTVVYGAATKRACGRRSGGAR
jgi:hypothetical protein